MRTAILHNFLIEATIMSSIAIVLMMILRKTLRRQLGNRAICFGWLLVAARLLPISFSNPLINSIRSPFASDAAIRPIAGQVLVRTRDALSDVNSIFWRAGNDQAVDMTNRMLNSIDYGTAGALLMQIYLIGAALVLGWFIFSNVRFRLKLRAGQIEPISGKLLQQYEDMCKERGVKPVPVIFTDPLPSACLVGVIRPWIALPLTASPADAIHVLTHEVCHLKNHDHLWSLLRLVCCVVHWFNPLVWIAADMSRTDTELRCDDRVVKPMNAEQKKAYANILVLAAARKNAPGVAVLATGMTMTGKKLKTRVLTVLKGKEPLRWLTVTFCVVASMCLVGAFATSETAEQLAYYEPSSNEAHHVTDTMRGGVDTSTESLAQKYANELWQDVLGGGESTTTVQFLEGKYYVQATENATGAYWYMRLNDSGIVVDYGCSALSNSVEGVAIAPQDNINYENQIVEAGDFMMPLIEQLAPGISGVTTAVSLEQIVAFGDVYEFHFSLMPKDEISDYVWVTVRKTPDGVLQLVGFTAHGNG